MEVLIPNDDPVRLLSVFVEDMELTDLYRTYGKIKKEQVTPRQLFKIVIYAAMNRIYSSRDMEDHLPFRYRDIVADAGYESEENYLYIESNSQIAFIKPNNYEKAKTRKYKKDIGRMENMAYDEEKDCYV